MKFKPRKYGWIKTSIQHETRTKCPPIDHTPSLLSPKAIKPKQLDKIQPKTIKSNASTPKKEKEREITKQNMEMSYESAKLAINLAKKRIHDRVEVQKERTDELHERHEQQRENEEKRVKLAVNLAKRRVQIILIQKQAQRRWSLDGSLMEITNDISTEKEDNRKLTFLCNRCSYLQDIMKKDGWIGTKRDAKLPADFTFWASSSIHREKRGALSQLARVSTMLLDNKKSCYLLLLANGLQHLQPPTFLTYEECAEYKLLHSTDIEEKSLWFLKKNGAACQKGVEVFSCLRDLKAYYDKLVHPHNWIIQREISHPYLINDRKTTLRIYALMTDDRNIYIYYKGVWVICSKVYDDTDCDRQAHCDHTLRDYEAEVRRNFDINDPHYEYIVKCAKWMVYDTIMMMGKQISSTHLKNRYHIFGYDLLFSMPNMKPWLIEINHYPSLRGSFQDGDGDANVKQELAHDFYNFVIKPYFYRSFEANDCVRSHWLLCTKQSNEKRKKV